MNKIKKFKNIKKVAIVLLFMTIVLVIAQAFGSKILEKNYENRKNVNNNFDEINISEFRIKTNFEKMVKERKIKIIGDQVFIGENDKQIENGYYDLKIYIQNNKYVVIALNKLWKNFDEKLYEENYISEITESIISILDINVPQKEIYDYILSGYLTAKNSDNNNHLNKEFILDLDKFALKGKVLEKEFVISIYKK